MQALNVRRVVYLQALDFTFHFTISQSEIMCEM